MFKSPSAIYAFIVVGSMVMAACQPAEGPAERAGKSIDNAAERVNDQVDKTADKVHDVTKK